MTKILGQPEPANGGALGMLAEGFQRIIPLLEEITRNTARPSQHIYCLQPSGPGQWLLYCLACSEADGRFVHPCSVEPPGPNTPPPGISVNP